MHLFGFSKKTKKKLSSGPLNLGLRRSKSTGNIPFPCHDTTPSCERDDSSTDSSGSSNGSNNSHDMKKHQYDQQSQEKSLTTGGKENLAQNHLALGPPPSLPKMKEDTNPPGLHTAKEQPNIKGISVSSIGSENGSVNIITTTEPTQPTKQQKQQTNDGAEPRSGENKWNSGGVDPGDLDTLLSMETQQRVNAQAERRDQAAAVESAPTTPLRPTRLKFELPVTPSRSRSPSNQPITYPRARPYRSHSEESRLSVDRRKPADAGRGKQGERKRRHRRWSKLIGSDTEDDDDDGDEKAAATAKRQLEVGAYVALIKRPLPTMGYVRYIGPVEGEPGDWVGVELEHRVGNCDGSIKGQRFFKTDPQRGIFTKRFDLEVVVA